MPKQTGKILPNPDRKAGDLVVYGLIPTDLPSLRVPNGIHKPFPRGGKVGAHGHHAGVQILKYASHPDVKAYIEDGLAHGADHFNTTITLDAYTNQIDSIIETAQMLGYVADKVVDPTYPWFVNKEDAKFLDDRCTVIWEVNNDEQVLVCREATTFGWLLGDKTDRIFKGLVGALKNLAE